MCPILENHTNEDLILKKISPRGTLCQSFPIDIGFKGRTIWPKYLECIGIDMLGVVMYCKYKLVITII